MISAASFAPLGAAGGISARCSRPPRSTRRGASLDRAVGSRPRAARTLLPSPQGPGAITIALCGLGGACYAAP